MLLLLLLLLLVRLGCFPLLVGGSLSLEPGSFVLVCRTQVLVQFCVSKKSCGFEYTAVRFEQLYVLSRGPVYHIS